MRATEIPVDVDVLREEIRTTYTDVSTSHAREFIFPTGRPWAQDLGYPEAELSPVPEATVASFAAVANHWLLGRAEPGSVVLRRGDRPADRRPDDGPRRPGHRDRHDAGDARPGPSECGRDGA